MKKLILYCFIILPALQGFTQNIPYPVVPDWESTPSGHVATGRVVVTFNELTHGTVHISLTDISGQLLTEETKIITKGQRTLYLDLHQIPKGVYLIRLANDHFTKTEKLIIQ